MRPITALCVLLLGTGLAHADRATLSTAKPASGQILTIRYSAADGILTGADSVAVQALLYDEAAEPHLHQAAMRRAADGWQVDLPLGAAVYGLYRFADAGVADTRDGLFWDFLVHGADDRPVQGAYRALAKSWVHPARGPLWGRAEDYDKARAAIAAEDALYPSSDDTRDLRWAIEIESGDPRPAALREITAWLADTAADFDGDWTAFWQRRQLYKRAGLDGELAAFEEGLLAKNKLVNPVHYERVYDAEKNGHQRVERARAFLARGDFSGVEGWKIGSLISVLIEGGLLDEAADHLAGQTALAYQVHQLGEALVKNGQAQRAADILHAEISAWKTPHPDLRALFESDEDFSGRRDWELRRLLETYGLALLAAGQQSGALAACREAYELTDGSSAANNARYVECLVAAGEYEQAAAITRASIESLRYSPDLLEFGRRAFAESGAGADEFAQIVARARARVERLDRRVPDFALQDFAGAPIRLSDLRGKVVVLDFWATWCPPCKAAFPYVQKVYEHYEGREDFQLYAVNTREALTGAKLRRAVDRFMAKHQYTFPVALDTSKAVYNQFQLIGIPTQLFFDRRGVLQFIDGGFHGPSMEHTMTARIDLLLDDALATDH